MIRALIADDDQDISELVAYKLRQAGFEVDIASDGPSALAAAESNRPDVAVLDVMMPGMSGIDVCRELRTRYGARALPIILLTARAQEADVQMGFEVGATDYLTKPFSPSELVTRIRAVLDRVEQP
jgi:DNA-binding response OmpR family regulator